MKSGSPLLPLDNTKLMIEHYGGGLKGSVIVQLYCEFGALLDLYIRQKPKYVVEIGSYVGGTLYYWLKYASPDTIVIGIENKYQKDLRKYCSQWEDVNLNQLIIIDQDSTLEATFEKVKEILPQIDFLFIDGDHNYPAVEIDYETYGSLVKKGTIALHDIAETSKKWHSQVLWEQIKKQSKNCIELKVQSPISDHSFGIGIEIREPLQKAEITVGIHVYRTAGNTFGEYLRRVFGNKHYFTDYEEFPAQHVQIPEDKDVCIHGHITADKYKNRFPNAHLITWVRDPLQRIISNYVWWQRIEYAPKSEDWKIFKKENWTLTQFALRSSEGYRIYDKMLCYSKGYKITDFRFIGIMEQFERSIRLFNKIYGIENPPEYESYFVNVDRSKYKDNRYKISLNEAETIIEANLIEFEIYEKAKMYFENLCDKYDID